MANRKLSIGCVLIMGGALTNCGGTVETRGDGTGNEHGGAPGSGGNGYVGVPVQGTGGGFMGTCCPGIAGTGGFIGGVGGFVGAGGPNGGRGGFTGVPGLPGAGGGEDIGGGNGPYGGDGGVGGDYWDGTAGEDSLGGAGGNDGI
jgi:hypothetical protein